MHVVANHLHRHFNINLLSSYTTNNFSTVVPNSWEATRPGYYGVKDADGSSELDLPDPQSDGSDSDEGYKSEPGGSEDENGADGVIQNYINRLNNLEEGHASGVPPGFRVKALGDLLDKLGEKLHN